MHTRYGYAWMQRIHSDPLRAPSPTRHVGPTAVHHARYVTNGAPHQTDAGDPTDHTHQAPKIKRGRRPTSTAHEVTATLKQRQHGWSKTHHDASGGRPAAAIARGVGRDRARRRRGQSRRTGWPTHRHRSPRNTRAPSRRRAACRVGWAMTGDGAPSRVRPAWRRKE